MEIEIMYNDIVDIAQTVNDFQLYVLDINLWGKDGIDWEQLLFNAGQYGEYTLQPDGTVDIDYGNMCFTAEKTENGKGRLTGVATYYPDDKDQEPIQILL